MLRTIISLDPNEKSWLDKEALIEQVSMAEIVRKAIRHYRLSIESQNKPNIDELLKKTSGIWNAGDALTYQKKMRQDWDK